MAKSETYGPLVLVPFSVRLRLIRRKVGACLRAIEVVACLRTIQVVACLRAIQVVACLRAIQVVAIACRQAPTNRVNLSSKVNWH